MIFWRGYGIMVVVITVLCLIGGKAAAEGIWGNPLPADKRQVYELLSMCIAAAAVYGLHVALKKHDRPRVVIDKETGEEIKLQAKHDLFFVPVKYWPIVLVVLGVMFFFQ